MKKLATISVLVACLLATSFTPALAENENDILFGKNYPFGKSNLLANSTMLSNSNSSEDSYSIMKPKRRKSSKRKGRRGGRGGSDVKQIQFGIEVGGNMSSSVISDDYSKLMLLSLGENGKYELTPGVGFQAGAYVDYNFSELLFVEGGVYLIQRTYNESLVGLGTITIEGNTVMLPVAAVAVYKPLYLQIPIQIGLNLNVSESFKFNVKAGGYFGFGISGKSLTTTTATIMGISSKPQETESDFFGEGISTSDYGLRFGLGAEISKITVGFFMDYSMGNLFKEVPEGIDLKQSINSFGVNVGYKF